MKFIQIIVFLTVLIGCSMEVNVTVHDKFKALELTKIFFTRISSENGIAVEYKNAHEEFKRSSSLEEFSNYITSIKNYINVENIKIVGYETSGRGDEVIVTYAQANSQKGSPLYLKLAFYGTDSNGYKLHGINVNNSKPFEIKGVYSEYEINNN